MIFNPVRFGSFSPFPRIPAFTAALGGFIAQTCPEIGLKNKKEGITPLLSVLTL